MNPLSILSKVPDSWKTSIVNALGVSFGSSSDSPSRSTSIYFPYDSTKEIDPRERRMLVLKHRSLRNNLGFVRSIIRTTARLSIGWGLVPMPKSGDKDFNLRATAYWKRNTGQKRFDVSAQDAEPKMQRLVCEETFVDGEIFGNKIVDGFGRPQRQLIKTEGIINPRSFDSTQNWKDGILLNSLRRPLRYGVAQGPLTGEMLGRVRQVPASQIIHLYDRERATQTHGLPAGYPGSNHGVDAIDILAFEKISHKLNTAIIGAMSSKSGAAPGGFEAIVANSREAARAVGTTPATEAERTKEGTKFLDLHGSMIPIFKTGDESMTFFNGRDSVNAVEFTSALCAQFAYGFGGLPVEFIVGMASGGANVRGMTDLAGRFFEEVQQMMVEGWNQPNWENVIGSGILAYAYPNDFPGIEPLMPPKGWTGWDVVEWRGPKNIGVDKARDGKYLLELHRAGLMSSEEWFTLNSEDPVAMRAQIDDELTERREQWLARGLPENMFWVREFGTNLSLANAATGEPDSDDAPKR
jgi:hypothetical protein